MTIKAVVSDVDGSITNSDVLYLSNGITGRTFSTYDGEGFAILKRHGIKVALVSQSDSPEIHHRAKWLGVEFYGGIKNKLEWLNIWSDVNEISLDKICYFGNDTNDINCLIACGYMACPRDANLKVLQYVNSQYQGIFVNQDGGHGAFRELVEHLV